jgi:hypothetical protein
MRRIVSLETIPEIPALIARIYEFMGACRAKGTLVAQAAIHLCDIR